MNKVQIARNLVLGFAVLSFLAATFSGTINFIAFGLMLWCLSVMIKVTNAKSGVFF